MTTKNKPIAVLISDIHFSLANLELATVSLLKAQYKAIELKVPLVIAGDLTDGKSILQGKVVNRLIQLFTADGAPETIILPGNHDRLNEKDPEHSLNFLKPYCTVVDDNQTGELSGVPALLIAYQNDSKKLEALLADEDNPRLIICHQGLLGAKMGHYIQDKTSLPPEAFKDYRVISGHYHEAQDIKCGKPRKGAVGLFSYLGSPYSQSFTEANDPDKGFAVLMSDGTLERIPTNLRQHRVLNYSTTEVKGILSIWTAQYDPKDILWVKVTGPQSELDTLNKEAIGKALQGHSNFKLEKIPTDSVKVEKTENKTGEQLMDALIEALPEEKDEHNYLKSLWREICA